MRTEAYQIKDQVPIETRLNEKELRDAITYYQTASYLYHHNLYNYTN